MGTQRVLEMSVMRERDEMRLRELGVPFDWTLLATLKRCVSNMAGTVLSRACEFVEARELRRPGVGEEAELVEGTVELVYKCYQVAGGFATDTMQHLMRLKALLDEATQTDKMLRC